VLTRHPNSPRANYGLAQTLCKQAEEQQSNRLLEECIELYQKVGNVCMYSHTYACVHIHLNNRKIFKHNKHELFNYARKVIAYLVANNCLCNSFNSNSLMS